MSRVWTALLAFLGFALSINASIAEPMRCQDALTATSTDGGQQVDLLIKNDSDDPVFLVWIDREGGKRPSGPIAPHGVRGARTYVGHVFTLQSAKDECVCATRMTARTRWTHDNGACRELTIAPYEPTASYHVEDIEGWRVLVSSAFKDRPDERKAALDALREDLAKIRYGLIPRSAVALLRKTKIWLEATDEDRASYLPYLEYLVVSNMNPDKVRSVQFTARSLDARKRGQPAVVLHELAHAFHDQALGYDDPEILAGYFRECGDAQLYNVERTEGRPERHYGLNDQTEFFAEFTEATFWENDYPPKDRADLLKFDPSIAALIKRSWKKLPTANVHLGAPHQVCPTK